MIGRTFAVFTILLPVVAGRAFVALISRPAESAWTSSVLVAVVLNATLRAAVALGAVVTEIAFGAGFAPFPGEAGLAETFAGSRIADVFLHSSRVTVAACRLAAPSVSSQRRLLIMFVVF